MAARSSISIAMVVTGALLLAAKGIFAKLLYARGVSLDALLVLRALISLPLLWGWAVFRVGLGPLLSADRRAILGACTAGLIGYYIGAWLDFRALQLIDASLERALLFSFPVFIVIARAVIYRAWPSPRVVFAVVLTYVGVILAVGGFNANLWRANAAGAGLVMITALTFTYYLLVNERVAATIGSAGFLVWAVTTATTAFCMHFAIAGESQDLVLDGTSWLLLVVMTAATNVVPLFLVAEGVNRIGAERAAIISCVGPPATIAMGALILGETMSVVQLIGTGFIVGGIVVLEVRLARGLAGSG